MDSETTSHAENRRFASPYNINNEVRLRYIFFVFSEMQLILFLHSCYSKIEAAKVCIDKYFTIRTHNLSFFKHLPLDLMQSTSSTV